MIDHLGIVAPDYARSKAFYAAALAPLGISAMMELTAEMTGSYQGTGFGAAGKPFFWVGEGKSPGGANAPTGGNSRADASPGAGIHIAFSAANRAAVDAFHRAALAQGGRDNGAPGLRPHYHANYYGAFVLDPDGNNVEAVCHSPP